MVVAVGLKDTELQLHRIFHTVCAVQHAEFFTEDRRYNLDFKAPNPSPTQVLSGAALLDLYSSYVSKFPIVSIEDPFDQVVFLCFRMTCSLAKQVCSPLWPFVAG